MQHADIRTVRSASWLLCFAGRCAGCAGCTLLQADGLRPERIASCIAKNAYVVSSTDAGTPDVPEFPIITHNHFLEIHKAFRDAY